MRPEPGTISLRNPDGLQIDVEDEHYQIAPRDLKGLLLYGRAVPILKVHRTAGEGDSIHPTISIEGHAAINSASKAVILYTRVGHYIVPLVSLHRVVKGAVISAPLFPLIPECPEGPA